MKKTLVVTTINSPTPALQESISVATAEECGAVIVGDEKTPDDFEIEGAVFLSLDDQKLSSFQSAKALPTGSYSRKIIGYLHSLAEGAELIYETDDDNALYAKFFDHAVTQDFSRVLVEPGFINHYDLFTSESVWPRGFPLDKVPPQANDFRKDPSLAGENEDLLLLGGLGLVQGLADGNPDVDAVFRLTRRDFDFSSFRFRPEEPVIAPGSGHCWLPLNSQVTIWPRESAMLMYLPVTCSFRMTDIWRGYVAQRVFHERDLFVLLPGPMAFQDRNDHDLMKDFADEVEGYLGYRRFIGVLDSTDISGLTIHNQLMHLYEELVQAGFFHESELTYLQAWISDVQSL